MRKRLGYHTGALRQFVVFVLFTVSALAQSALDQAISLARQKRYPEARALLETVAEPGEPQRRIAFHRLRAAVASGLGENAGAAHEMNLALALAPDDPGLLLATAAAELAAGALDNALQRASSAGNSAAAQSLLGDIHEKRGEYVEAAKAYQSAVALAPDREEYRIALALELVQHQTFLPAITVLEQAAPLFPKSARIRTLLGITQYALGNTRQAVSALTDAIQINPRMEPAYTYLARILLESSASPPQDALENLCRWDNTVCAALKLRVAREQNNPALQTEATRTLEQAPSASAVARCELGRSYAWSGRWADARAQMEACVHLDPAPQNHYRLAHIYQQLGMAALAHREMTLRDQALRTVSEENQRRLDAIQAFRFTVK